MLSANVKVNTRINYSADINKINHNPKLIAIGGGKGGIGKSFFSVNIGIALANSGYKIALVDLDLGAANLHTCLGVQTPRLSLLDFINNKVENLEEIGMNVGIDNIVLYAGGQEFWQQIRPQSVQKIRVISKLQNLDADYVLLDLGAGTHITTQDFFIFSHAGIVVVIPEPTSIENAYVFLKGVFVRRVETIVKSMRQGDLGRPLLESLQEDAKVSVPPLQKIINFANKEPEIGKKILELIKRTKVGFIVNQVRSQNDVDIGTSMMQICNKYFGFSAEFLGSVPYDDNVWKSIRARNPLLTCYPQSSIGNDINGISHKIFSSFIPIDDHKETNK